MNEKEIINWTRINDRYVRLQTGKEKRLTLKRWRDGIWFGKQGVSFEVEKEDGNIVAKQFTVVSRRLLSELQPLIERAETKKKDTITVSILRLGTGFETQYEVDEVKSEVRK